MKQSMQNKLIKLTISGSHHNTFSESPVILNRKQYNY